jgi:predicted NBD/HSP70 family sugar kinase
MIVGLFRGAEAKTVEAGHMTLPWTGTDVIDDLGDGGQSFERTITGTILGKHFPEASASAQIHAAN